jgi:hypothetical protein
MGLFAQAQIVEKTNDTHSKISNLLNKNTSPRLIKKIENRKQ